MRDPIRNCLSGLSDQQDIVLYAVNRRGKSIQCRISCNPLTGFDRERQGVILLIEEV